MRKNHVEREEGLAANRADGTRIGAEEMTGSRVDALCAGRPRTPYFVIDEEQLSHDYTMLTESLEKAWPHYRVGYSFKTNSLPWLVTYLKERGAFAEVVSADEYSLARYLGYEDEEIIYNGPCKERESFEKVLRSGGIVNLDGEQELVWLSEISRLHPEECLQVGIRVNFDLESMCPGQTTMGVTSGRFGFCYENGVFARTVARIRRMENVRIAGLHLHSSSKSRSVAVFEAIASMAVSLQREFCFALSYVDIGGGYCGGLKGRPEYPDYFPAIGKVLREVFTPEQTMLIVEPGISLLSKATTFTTSVLDVRDIRDKRYLITDGSRFNIDPTMIKSSHLFHLELSEEEIGGRPVLTSQCVSGFTCMEVDRLFEYENGPQLERGDRIVYENVGGYTMSLNPLFIRYFPDVYIRRDGELLKVRERWTPKEYVQNCMMYGQEGGKESLSCERIRDNGVMRERGAISGNAAKRTLLVVSCGTRNKLLRFFREPGNGIDRVIAADCSPYAPALYEADRHYIVPRMTEPGYLDRILEICRAEGVNGLLPLFEDELTLMAENRALFEREGVRVIVSEADAIGLCRDKYLFYRYMKEQGIPVLPSFCGLEEFDRAYAAGQIDFPVFIKPVRGCGSIGIRKVDNRQLLQILCENSRETMLIQPFAAGQEYGVDVYVDMISRETVAVFAKKKIRMRAGETEKSVSVKDEALFDLARRSAAALKLAGPVDMDIFNVDGKWYLSEINPRFGGGYPHAYHCGVDFTALIGRNLAGTANEAAVGEYEEGLSMMKFSDEVTKRISKASMPECDM